MLNWNHWHFTSLQRGVFCFTGTCYSIFCLAALLALLFLHLFWGLLSFCFRHAYLLPMCSLFICCFHGVYTLLYSDQSGYLPSSSLWHTPLRTFFHNELIVMNCLDLCLPWKTFIFPSMLKHRILGSLLFTFKAWDSSFHVLLASVVDNVKYRGNFDVSVFECEWMISFCCV